MEFVRRRPRPVVGPGGPQHSQKIWQIQRRSLHLANGVNCWSRLQQDVAIPVCTAHLEDLRKQLHGYQVINVACDNARFKDCRGVREFLGSPPRPIRPPLSPEVCAADEPGRPNLVALKVAAKRLGAVEVLFRHWKAHNGHRMVGR